MHLPLCTRREGLTLGVAAAASALLPLREALAQTRSAARDWLAMIRQHHDLIARSFEELMAKNEASYEQLDLQIRTVDQLLKAHSLAEENVIYPAMARAGMLGDAERLYMDEAHIKIAKSRLDLAARAQGGSAEWQDAGRFLRDLVLKHARGDEEARLFPELKRKLDAQQNRLLGELYAREFSTVIPVRR